jgi:hypothetical protein
MDDLVQQAMRKWPNVPHCHGWLGLDDRGDWYMRDDAVQALGPFPQSKGSKLTHTKLIEFIQRNYAHDEFGQWFFQNGPQRVYVELMSAPFVWRIQADLSVTDMQGRGQSVSSCVLDEAGRVYLDTEQGLGLVHSQDVGLAAQVLEQGLWRTQEKSASELALDFGFVKSPQQRAQMAT